ncbi:ATP-binding protein [Roseovarius sp. S1116L3]|uniref:hybrid sensor histidine kinase/response regulator n=1 Tax=Roseovarius roseus TaxID=3342636 RepID=UPI0037276AA9
MSDTSDEGQRPHADCIDARLSLFISDAPVALAMFDRDMRYVAGSKLWVDRHGPKGPDTQQGRPLRLPKWLRDAHQRAVGGEEVSCDEEAITHEGGCPTWERWRVRPVAGANGDIVGSAVFFEDISAQKAAEARCKDSETRLRLMIDAVGVGLVERDLETGEGAASETFRKLIGLAEDAVPTDLDRWIELLSPSDPEAFREARRRALDPGGDGFFKSDVRPTVEDQKRDMQLIGRVMFSGPDGAKKPERFVGVLIDDTERSELQMSLARSQRLETVGRIAGIIAHDFNNLLSVILANLELAALRVSDRVTSDLLQSAIDSAEMGGDFNKKLLSLSGQKDTVPPLIRLDDHILKTWAMLERLLNERAALHFRPGAEHQCIRMNPSELDGAILNLVLNARDAQPDGGEIVIATRTVDISEKAAETHEDGKPGRFLELSVSDQGIGMTAADIRKAREPFFTSKPPTLGTGLGLTSVAASVARADGFIAIESEPEQGTKVSLFLPIAECSSSQGIKQRDMPLGNGELILVVEDDDMVREATLKRLEALGYAVIESADGSGALQLLAEGEPVDLVFSDVVMPGGISGYDLVGEVARHYPHVAVLLTSGHSSIRGALQTDAGPVSELLKKPYSMAVLAQAVERALRPPEIQE